MKTKQQNRDRLINSQKSLINTFGIRPPPRPNGSALPLAEGSVSCEPTSSEDLFFSAEFSIDVFEGTSWVLVAVESPDKSAVSAQVSPNWGCCCIQSRLGTFKVFLSWGGKLEPKIPNNRNGDIVKMSTKKLVTPYSKDLVQSHDVALFKVKFVRDSNLRDHSAVM